MLHFIIEKDILIRYEGDETDIVIPAGFVKGIAGGVFRDCAVRTGITGVTIPGSVKHIGENAFADCTALADVRIEAGVTDIGAGAFAGCTALESLNIPAGVTGLGERIVSGCDRLTELVVHESVTTIAPGAFTGIGQKKITYRAKKAKWEKLVADTGIRQDLAGFTVHCTDGDWNGPEQTATTPGDNTGDKKDPNTGEENPPHTHDWGNYEVIDKDNHKAICVCGDSKDEAHVYDDEDDAECNVCGYLKENPGDPTCEHVFDYKEIDDGYHIKTCMKNCGASSTEPHNYGTVTYQDDGHHQTCADCNHPKIEKHNYIGASYENKGEAGHSRTCTVEGCGYIEAGVHSLGECESDGNGGHQKTCTAGCGYSEPVPHDWNTPYTTDADKHYKTCKIAGCTAHDEEGLHQYEGKPYKDDGTGKHYRECKVCNYQSAPVGHTWSATYTNDKNGGHYQTCTATGCDAHSESTPHDPQYEKIDDSNHRVTCKATGCDYSVTEKHQYDKGVCACGSKLELAGGTIENGVLVSYDKKDEKNVVIPDGVTGIGGNAFQNCWGLETVVIPDSVTSIGGSAFAGCHGLTEVTIPGSVDTIGQGAFQNCTGLKEVTIENGVKNIEHGAFERCEGLTEVTIPGSVDTIGQGAFQNCTGLKEVTIENGVRVVGNEAFQGCSNLTDVTIPDSVTSIGDNAFEGCVNLRGITIPKSVTSIGIDALKCGVNLKTITYCGTVAEWLALSKDSGVGDNVTVKCTDGTVPWDITEDKTLRHYYGRETNVQIPWDSVESIGKAAFAATGVTNVTITQGVKHIDDGAFQGCGSLTHVEIPMSVTIIGYHAFYVCDKLETITFGGTRAQWGALTTANDIGIGNGVTVECSDGTITTP